MTDRELLNKYNTVVAKYKDIEETMRLKSEQWEKTQAEFNVVTDAARKLCTEILSKDKNELNLGKDSQSWSSIGTKELINKSLDSYKNYNKTRSDLMCQLLDLAEDRQNEIEGLKSELEYYTTGKSFDKGATPNNQEDENNENNENNNNKEKDPDLNTNPDNNKNSGEKSAVNEINYNDDDNSTVTQIAALVDSAVNNSTSPKIKENQGTINAVKKNRNRQKSERQMTSTISVNDTIDKMSEMQKDIIEIIGSTGTSLLTEIIKKLKETKKDMPYNSLRQNIYGALKELNGLQAVNREQIAVPKLAQKVGIVYFTDFGGKIYKTLTGKNPQPSQAQKIIADHDNLEHGYAIYFIAQEIKKTGLYNNVEIDRRKNTRYLDEGKKRSYIPDIYAVSKDSKKKYYCEYERGNTSLNDIYGKCNKMIVFTKDLYYIAPSIDVADHLLKDISSWKESKNKNNFSVNVHIATISWLYDNQFDLSKPWMYEMFGTGTEVVNNHE